MEKNDSINSAKKVADKVLVSTESAKQYNVNKIVTYEQLRNIGVDVKCVDNNIERIDKSTLRIMRSDWDYIKSKLDKISFKKFPINITEILIGAIIIPMINIINGTPSDNDIKVSIICLTLITIINILGKYIKFIKPISIYGNDQDNKLHFDDINDKIKEVDKRIG